MFSALVSLLLNTRAEAAGALCSVAVLLHVLDQLLHVLLGTEEDGRALVDLGGLQVEHALAHARNGQSARLLQDERHRVALVQKAQLKCTTGSCAGCSDAKNESDEVSF